MLEFFIRNVVLVAITENSLPSLQFPFRLRIIKVHMVGSEYAKRYPRFITPTIAAYRPG